MNLAGRNLHETYRYVLVAANVALGARGRLGCVLKISDRARSARRRHCWRRRVGAGRTLPARRRGIVRERGEASAACRASGRGVDGRKSASRADGALERALRRREETPRALVALGGSQTCALVARLAI